MHARRFVVGVSGSAGSLQALRYAARLARADNAVLAPVLAWVPPGGQLADRQYPCAELRQAWKRAAQDRLARAIELAIGGPPPDLEFRPRVVCGSAGQVLTELAGPEDVLVIGAGRVGGLRRVLACRVSWYCLGHARCPVIAVPPAQLAAQARGLPGWVIRRRLHPEGAGAGAGAGAKE